MVRAIARQAEAERERRAKVIHAEGELQAAAALLEAAQMLAQQPAGDAAALPADADPVAGDKSSTIVFPLPMDLIGNLLGRAKDTAPGDEARTPGAASDRAGSGRPGSRARHCAPARR